MKDRVYILLNVSDGKGERVAEALSGMSGVATVDVLEGPPDVMIMIEALGRRKLAQLTVNALAAVEAMTEGIRLMPAVA